MVQGQARTGHTRAQPNIQDLVAVNIAAAASTSPDFRERGRSATGKSYTARFIRSSPAPSSIVGWL